MELNSALLPPSAVQHHPSLTEESSIQSKTFLNHVLEIDKVTIVPAAMVFSDAYEGKRFQQNLNIRNKGRNKACIRVVNPTSQTFQVKSGYYELSSGLSLILPVIFTYRSVLPSLSSTLPISINEKWIDFKLFVTISSAVIKVEPKLLDFGQNDVVSGVVTRKLIIRNTGSKGGYFSIDLGRNDLDLQIKPMKGMVAAKSSTSLFVEMIPHKVWDYKNCFWIKWEDKPIRVQLAINTIEPKFEIQRLQSKSFDFALLDFPLTYCNGKSTRIIMMKNHSSTACMFCIFAVVGNEVYTLDKAHKVDRNYKNFVINPNEGYANAAEVVPITITFAPEKETAESPVYAACFLKIIRINFQKVKNPTAVVYQNQDVIPDMPKHQIKDAESLLSVLTAINDNMMTPRIEGEDKPEIEVFRTVFVYGEMEEACLTLRPDQLFLYELVLGQVYNRELLIENRSRHLSVLFVYEKTASIEVNPKTGLLKPMQKVEVIVSIRPAKLGLVKTELKLGLYYPNYPKDTGISRIGNVTLKIEYQGASVVKIPRTKCSINVGSGISKILEPDKKFQYRDIELELKTLNKQYYLEFLKGNEQLREIPLKNYSDYDVAFIHPLPSDVLKCKEKEKVIETPYGYYPPLPPGNLHKIKILPKVKTVQIASSSIGYHEFTLENQNEIAIKVEIRCSKSFISFSRGTAWIVPPKRVKKIPFDFMAANLGRHIFTLEVIINKAHFYTIIGTGYVTPRVLHTPVTKFIINGGVDDYQLLELNNFLNCSVSYTCRTTEPKFQLFPSSGEIRAKQRMYVMIYFLPTQVIKGSTECTLTTEIGLTTVSEVQYCKLTKDPLMGLNTLSVNFGSVAINTTASESFTLRNFSPYFLFFSIKNPEPIKGVVVTPAFGQLHATSDQIFEVTLHLRRAAVFCVVVEILVQGEFIRKVQISASVEYPNIKPEPPFVVLRDMYPYSFQREMFKFTNLSPVEHRISFAMEDHLKEFSLKDCKTFCSITSFTLAPGEKKEMYIYYEPTMDCRWNFCLPYVINEMIGPHIFNMVETYNPVSFFEDICEFTTNSNEYPEYHTLVTVCCIKEHLVKFSTLNIEFIYYGKSHPKNTASSDFEVTNVCDRDIDCCIRIEDLRDCVEMNCEKAQRNDYSLSFRLDPGEVLVFKITFDPQQFRNYNFRLPIYLKNINNNCAFNYLNIKASCIRPTMIPSEDIIYFDPIPVGIQSEIKFVMTFENHYEKCDFRVSCDIPLVIINYGPKIEIPRDKFFRRITLRLNAFMPCSSSSDLSFSCSCESSCLIPVKVAVESSIITNHIYIRANDPITVLSNFEQQTPRQLPVEHSSLSMDLYKEFTHDNETPYPFFPADEEDDNFSVKLRDVVKIIEEWVYNQGFFSRWYYKIPDDFAAFPVIIDPTKIGGKKPKVPMYGDALPLVRLIMNLAGDSLYEELVPSNFSLGDNTDMEMLNFSLKTYTNTLQLLNKLGAVCPQVEPKYLLNYKLYECYCKNISQRPPIFERTKFYRFSKHCWMDVILQTYKVLVIERLVVPKIDKMPPMCVYSEKEYGIIRWLTDQYAVAEPVIWTSSDTFDDTGSSIVERQDNKSENLINVSAIDGLFLGTIIAYHCPYTIHLVEKMTYNPITDQEKFHNFCRLSVLFQYLNFSFKIHPKKIMNKHFVFMSLLVNYIYEVLPGYIPKDLIEIKAPMLQEGSARIPVKNLGNSMITYKPLFFGKDKDLFYVKAKIIKVPREKTAVVVVNFKSKSMEKANAVLVLCGEVIGQRFAKSLAFNLEGSIDYSVPIKQYVIPAILYKKIHPQIVLQSPIEGKATYEVFYCPSDPPNPTQWSKQSLYIFFDKFLKFDDKGECKTVASISPLILGTNRTWIFLKNADLGVWGVKIIIKCRLGRKQFLMLYATVPAGYNILPCKCGGGPNFNRNCPRIFKIQIPSKNFLKCECMKDLIMNYWVVPEEAQYWSNIFSDSCTGYYLMHLILKMVLPTTQEKFTVRTDRHSSFVATQKLTIPNILSNDFVELPIHPIGELKQGEFITMNGITTKEARLYKVFFSEQQ